MSAVQHGPKLQSSRDRLTQIEGELISKAMRVTSWVVAWTLLLPSPCFGSSIEVLPKASEKEEDAPRRAPEPKKPAEPGPPARPRPRPAETDARLLSEAPPPRFRWKTLPLVGIGAAVVTGAIGTGLLIGASGELDADRFTFDAEERADGTIDVAITDDFRDAQRAVILKGFGGTFMVSASATLLTVSLLELFRQRGR